MKKMTMILATWLMLTSHVQAQMVQENEAAIVYYMPKTELVITLEYDVIKRTPGVFYQYAERYLGTKEVWQWTSRMKVLIMCHLEIMMTVLMLLLL